MKPNSIMFLLMGLAFSTLGAGIIIKKGFESSRYGFINFGDYHQLVGSVVLLFGIIVIASAFRLK